MWTSIVGYFRDSSGIAAIYGLITQIVIKESTENQKVVYLIPENNNFYGDIDQLCEQSLLFNFTSLTGNLSSYYVNDYFTSNYFIVPYFYGSHELGTTTI